MKNTNEVKTLFETVVEGGYCIGCGACTAVENSPIGIALDEYGKFEAKLELDLQAPESQAKVLAVCPFSNSSINEDEIGKDLYGDSATYHNKIGYYLDNYAGYVTEMDFRERGSSGGMAKWILYELFQENLIDAVVQVEKCSPDQTKGQLYRFNIAKSVEQILEGSKSVYYPVEMSEVLNYIKENPGRYAITGVPCFIKAIRLLSRQELVYKERIHFCIGIICGHLKSSKYAEMLAWQFGIEPGNLASIDFRKKIPGRSANEKGVEVVSRSHPENVESPRVVQDLFGTNYGYGLFKYIACDYCDDVVAETADISIGDAWLPEYVASGNSVVIVRNKKILDLIEQARISQRLHLNIISPEKIVKSQDAGLRHRREGLAYRLHLKDAEGVWRPTKRVQAGDSHLSEKQKQIYLLRKAIAIKSHDAYKEAVRINKFSEFQKKMSSLLLKYKALYMSPWKQGIISWLQKLKLDILYSNFIR